jgi:hypothetical protein
MKIISERPRANLAALLVCAVLPRGCDSAPSNSIFVAHGDTVVVSTSGLVPGLVGRLTAARALADTAGTAHEFARVIDLWPTASGDLYALDMIGGTMLRPEIVLKHFSFGTLARTIGRAGRGPGEFRDPAGVRVLRNGNVAVSDRGLVHVFTPDGEHIETWNGAQRGDGLAPKISIDTLGNIYLTINSGERLGTRVGTWSMVRLRPDGSLVDTLEWPFQGVALPQQLERNVVVPFHPSYHVAWSPDGHFVTAFSDRYAVDLRVGAPGGDLPFSWREGDTVRSIRRMSAPVPVLRRERADHMLGIELFMRSGGGPRDWTFRGPAIPEYKPPIRSLEIAADGRIWVGIHQRAELIDSVMVRGQSPRLIANRWKEAIVFEVFEPGGAFVGRVALPDELGLRAARGDTLWAVAEEAGIVTVRRFEVRWHQ